MVDSSPLPEPVLEIVGSQNIEVVASSATSRRLQTSDHLILECSSGRKADELAARILWLNSHVGALEVLATKERWVIGKRPSGNRADQPEHHAEPGYLASRVAAAVQELHHLDVSTCPFRRTWEDCAADIEASIERGDIQSDNLPDPYSRYGLAELRDMFGTGRPKTEDLVVALGAPSLQDFYFDGDTLTGLVPRSTLGVADRNVDLAWLHRDVRETYGDEAVFSFYDSYGPGESLVAIDKYMLASYLLS